MAIMQCVHILCYMYTFNVKLLRKTNFAMTLTVVKDIKPVYEAAARTKSVYNEINILYIA